MANSLYDVENPYLKKWGAFSQRAQANRYSAPQPAKPLWAMEPLTLEEQNRYAQGERDWGDLGAIAEQAADWEKEYRAATHLGPQEWSRTRDPNQPIGKLFAEFTQGVPYDPKKFYDARTRAAAEAAGIQQQALKEQEQTLNRYGPDWYTKMAGGAYKTAEEGLKDWVKQAQQQTELAVTGRQGALAEQGDWVKRYGDLQTQRIVDAANRSGVLANRFAMGSMGSPLPGAGTAALSIALRNFTPLALGISGQQLAAEQAYLREKGQLPLETLQLRKDVISRFGIPITEELLSNDLAFMDKVRQIASSTDDDRIRNAYAYAQSVSSVPAAQAAAFEEAMGMFSRYMGQILPIGVETGYEEPRAIARGLIPRESYYPTIASQPPTPYAEPQQAQTQQTQQVQPEQIYNRYAGESAAQSSPSPYKAPEGFAYDPYTRRYVSTVSTQPVTTRYSGAYSPFWYDENNQYSPIPTGFGEMMTDYTARNPLWMYSNTAG